MNQNMTDKKKDRPFVCVRCMTFNHEAYIEDALNGFVIQQTTFPFVVAIINDASTDKTKSVINEFVENNCIYNPEIDLRIEEYGTVLDVTVKDNPHCIFHIVHLNENHYGKKSKLPYFAKYENAAKYVAMCEGDDYWTDPLKLQRQVDFLEANPDYGMVATAFQQVRNAERLPFDMVIYEKDEIVIDDILKGLWIATMTVMYRSVILQDYTPPFDKLLMGDLPLWGYIAMHYRVGYMKDITATYRKLDASTCHFVDPKNQYIFDLHAMRVREYYAILASRENIIQPIFAHNTKYMLDQCYKYQWFDFPVDVLWRLLLQYSTPSGYDRLKYIALKHPWMYKFASMIIVLKLRVK